MRGALLGPAPVRDVLAQPDHAGGGAVVAQDRARGGPDVDRGPVGADDPELAVEPGPRLERPREAVEHLAAVAGAQRAQPSVATHVRVGQAEQLAEAPVRVPTRTARV